MDLDSLDKLEERIGKAVAHIGKLTEARDLLEEENKQLTSQKVQLEKELKDKEVALQKLKKQSGKISEKVKEKVEGLLNKINNYEHGLG